MAATQISGIDREVAVIIADVCEAIRKRHPHAIRIEIGFEVTEGQMAIRRQYAVDFLPDEAEGDG